MLRRSPLVYNVTAGLCCQCRRRPGLSTDVPLIVAAAENDAQKLPKLRQTKSPMTATVTASAGGSAMEYAQITGYRPAGDGKLTHSAELRC